jgi:hypothetical protein
MFVFQGAYNSWIFKENELNEFGYSKGIIQVPADSKGFDYILHSKSYYGVDN